MPAWLIPAIMAGASVLGGALAGRSKKTTQETIEPPQFTGLRDTLIQQALSRLKSPSELIPGYEATGIRNINENSDLSRQSLENRLGGAGLLGSGVHGAGLTGLETRRFGDINDLQNIELPRLSEDIYNQRFGQALGVYGSRMPGVNVTTPGNMAAGAVQSPISLLAYLYGSGALKMGGGSGSLPSSGGSVG